VSSWKSVVRSVDVTRLLLTKSNCSASRPCGCRMGMAMGPGVVAEMGEYGERVRVGMMKT
jgi:hypothetical protein